MKFDDLVDSSLVGTSRRAPQLSDADASVSGALAVVGAESPEAQLLGAAAILSNYESCGTVPTTVPELPQPAAPDTRPPCSRGAKMLLDQLLAMTNTPAKQQLTLLWLGSAERVSQRVPHALLPALLEYGAETRDARAMIANVIDRRGQWLMSLNRRWQFAADQEVDVGQIWSTGNRDQRISAIHRHRATNAASARDLIASTWNEDGADDRTAFVEAMRIGLSPDDEAFLETALDDRSKQVRAAAADVLARLPGSALVRRMIDRVKPLLQFTPGAKGGLLKKAKPAEIAVTLPKDSYEEIWARDGITEKPEDRTGRRQWWLLQMLRAIPPAHWATKWQCPPAECITATTGEFGDLVLRGFADAAERANDGEWAAAIVAAYVFNGRGDLRIGLVRQAPVELQRTTLVQLLQAAKMNLPEILQVLEAIDTELDTATVGRIFRTIRQNLKDANVYSYAGSAVLERLSFKTPISMYDELATMLTDTDWNLSRKAVDAFLQVLQLRRDIQKEFAQ